MTKKKRSEACFSRPDPSYKVKNDPYKVKNDPYFGSSAKNIRPLDGIPKS